VQLCLGLPQSTFIDTSYNVQLNHCNQFANGTSCLALPLRFCVSRKTLRTRSRPCHKHGHYDILQRLKKIFANNMLPRYTLRVKRRGCSFGICLSNGTFLTKDSFVNKCWLNFKKFKSEYQILSNILSLLYLSNVLLGQINKPSKHYEDNRVESSKKILQGNCKYNKIEIFTLSSRFYFSIVLKNSLK